jgi:uncharacterized protein YaaQ
MTNSSNMRLIIAVVRGADSENILQALLKDGYRVTRISSTGGFLRRGNATLLIGVEADKVKTAIQMIHANSAPAIDPGLKRATIFVLKVDRFVQLD